jgi:CRISPR-associated protein Cas1
MFDEASQISLLLSERIESLDAERDTLIVRLKEDKPRKYPLRSLREIILLHGCTVESNALAALADANVPLLLLNGRGEYAATLWPGPIKNFYPRQAQFDAYRDPARRLEIARRIVEVKLDSFRRIARERDDPYDPATEDKAIATAADFDGVRGVEGAATREHYARMSRWLRGGQFVFVERTKRPPRDPVNALLSLSYTLTMNTTLAAVNTVGLDPAFGFLHEDYYGRPSLACDLMESWRTDVAERFVLRTVNRRELRQEHFEDGNPADGVLLNAEGRKEYFGRWFPFIHEEKRSLPGFVVEVTFREAIFASVRSFSKWLRGETDSWPPSWP